MEYFTSHNSLLSLTSDNIHLVTNQQNNIYLATRQTFLTSQNAQINIIKKNKKDNNHKDKKKPKKEKKDIVDSPTIDPLTKNSEDIYLFISTHLCMHA
jgi:hypothetical protein